MAEASHVLQRNAVQVLAKLVSVAVVDMFPALGEQDLDGMVADLQRRRFRLVAGRQQQDAQK